MPQLPVADYTNDDLVSAFHVSNIEARTHNERQAKILAELKSRINKGLFDPALLNKAQQIDGEIITKT